ncbi:hypothetical protein NL526_28405, partial [Klebsiella pneumoniae]|nr:hypothetical protein [Klebsiella pneumoniae]
QKKGKQNKTDYGARTLEKKVGNRTFLAAYSGNRPGHQGCYSGADIGAEDNGKGIVQTDHPLLGEDYQNADGNGGRMDKARENDSYGK